MAKSATEIRRHTWDYAGFEPSFIIIGTKRYAVNPGDEISMNADGSDVTVNGLPAQHTEWKVDEGRSR